MDGLRNFFKEWVIDFFKYIRLVFAHFVANFLSPRFAVFESFKSNVVGKMYQQRGKNAQMFVNIAMVTVMVVGVAFGPSLVSNDSQTQAVLTSAFRGNFVFAEGNTGSDAQVLGLATDTQVTVDPMTQVSDKPRSDVMDYTVVQGDTLASIAKMFGVDTDSIKWQNPGISEKKVKVGSVLKIPPVTGVVHTVKSGETIYSIAKVYGVSAQSIVDYPFNEFTNDETFALAIGQQLIVPDGVMPNVEVTSPRVYLANMMTPNAGAVAANGHFIWPTKGIITQYYKPWHKALDIANPGAPMVMAADSGTVVHASWDSTGYGNMVMIDHGNGYKTVYGHLQKFAVTVGQTVKRGDTIGQMGSTGRSTGTHLHFEIRTPLGLLDPTSLLPR
jgi:murein DD-endopeptidase MepM/ murein hydrolase activator NlpD